MNTSNNGTAQMQFGHLDTLHTNLLVLFYIVFCIIGIFGNVCIAHIIFSSRVYRRRFCCLFLVNLAIADALVCLTTTPYYVMSLWMKQQDLDDHDPLSSQHNSICKLPMFFNFFTGFLRILSLTLMSIDRYIAINHPYFYAHHCAFEVGKIWGIASIIYVWLQSIVTTIPAMVNNYLIAIVFFGSNGRMCGIMWSKSNTTFYAILMLVNFLLPAILIVFTNCKVFWLARKHVVRERIKKQCLEKSYRITSTFRNSKSPDRKDKNKSHRPSKISIQVGNTKDEESPTTSDYRDMIPDDCLYCPMKTLNNNEEKTRPPATIFDSRRSSSLKKKTIGIGKLAFETVSPGTGGKGVNIGGGCGKSTMKQKKHRISSDWEIALSTLALVIFYFTSYLPFMVTRLLATSRENGISMEVVAYTTLLTTLGSSINPLIVFKTRSEFRRILKEKMCGCRNAVHIFRMDDSSSMVVVDTP